MITTTTTRSDVGGKTALSVGGRPARQPRTRRSNRQTCAATEPPHVRVAGVQQARSLVVGLHVLREESDERR